MGTITFTVIPLRQYTYFKSICSSNSLTMSVPDGADIYNTKYITESHVRPDY